MLDLVWLIPALPLAGFLAILVFGRRLGDPKAGWFATLMAAASFVATLGVFLDLLSKGEEERHHVVTLFSWVPVAGKSIDMAFLADPLSITMALFVTGIGSLIHLYAIGYMHGDPRFSKFFLYLNLFVFSMLMLVLGSNLLVTFLGWEGVGTCSYLLISFWHERDSAATAGKKAFVTNRVGDWGFMMAMFFAFWQVGSLDYSALGGLTGTTATAVALFAFIGACGKSAQLPLYLWLPDAMEGPTPVSALIHAATMVTAGVFLMVRLNPVLHAADSYAGTIIAIVGVATALFAATVAVAQNDIKKVLAYSTVSQLGYMFLAVGSGAYVAAIFHMVTHAFFKALLFLGSGSVIHGMHHEQDMRKMGALRVLMPITAGTFIVGWLAIAGVPPFAGFWSKDEILLFAYDKSPVLYALGLAAAVLTAYYMTRQVIMVFFGQAKWKDAHEEHGAHGDFEPHESPKVMLIPLVVLAGLSIVGGGLQLPFNESVKKLEHWLEPVVAPGEHHLSTGADDIKYVLMGVAILAAVAGIVGAYLVYAKHKAKPIEPTILAEGWYYDKAVSDFMGGPGRAAFEGVAWADATIVDGAVNGAGALVQAAAGEARKVQSGNVRNYAAVIGIGVTLLLGWFVIVRGLL
ncbi:MAG: NADH-quinone oxidoreductase subunit L [Acidimicrobiaceae bacterium]|nr:NADH-quinone oxidoreductase subunit L [Ilumatobacter sp.]MCB9382729.1 NADH-quinone oxidoreductase subunit L [Acidimicrobiaceae bacterium]MCO5331739.1 NADH-quinone oxidoreductase subunit L [Ilumatobacteraceae bacterium]